MCFLNQSLHLCAIFGTLKKKNKNSFGHVEATAFTTCPPLTSWYLVVDKDLEGIPICVVDKDLVVFQFVVFF